MNLGYPPDGDFKVREEDMDQEYEVCLYNRLTHHTSFEGKKVLEVGSGRGGGCYFLHHYCKAGDVTGIDLSSKNIRLCRKSISYTNIHFRQGDAENIPFEANGFDIVMNLESSHCYPNPEQFVREVKRVLQPGGTFLFGDIRPVKRMLEMEQYFEKHGFSVQAKEDITEKVMESIRANSQFKEEFFKKHTRLPKRIIRNTVVFEDSAVYRMLKNGEMTYQLFVLANA